MTPDPRLDAPAFHRNHAVIGETIDGLLKAPSGHVLEFGSGTGQHVIGFARAMPRYRWWPSDIDTAHLESIDAWRCHSDVANVEKPVTLDLSAPDWEFGSPGMPPREGLVAAVCINVLHIAPWEVAEGLFRGCGRYLTDGSCLIIYGPFRRDGRHTAASNASFDASLRRRNPAWGVRDSADLQVSAGQHGLELNEVIRMPANNFVLCFVKSKQGARKSGG